MCAKLQCCADVSLHSVGDFFLISNLNLHFCHTANLAKLINKIITWHPAHQGCVQNNPKGVNEIGEGLRSSEILTSLR